MGSWCSSTATVRTEEEPANEDRILLEEQGENEGYKDSNKNIHSIYSPLPTPPLPSVTDTDSKFRLKLYLVQHD